MGLGEEFKAIIKVGGIQCAALTSSTYKFPLLIAQVFNVAGSREFISKLRCFSSVGSIHLWKHQKHLPLHIDLNGCPG